MEIERYIVADDRALVEWAKQGDNYAFDQLFNRYRDSIRILYTQRTGSVEDAEDLLQETFVKVYLNLDTYKNEYTFGQWVYTIARNSFIDYVRKRREDIPLESAYFGVMPIANADAPNPEERVISLQQRAQLDVHIQKLTPKYKQLIEYRFFMDYSYEEISKKLNLPLGTVKTQIHRARERLCKFIVEDKG